MHINYCTNKEEVSSVELPENTQAQDLAEKLNLKAPHQAVIAIINGVAKDLSTILKEGDTVRLLSFDDPQGKEVFWHTSAHLLAQAVLRLYPDAQPTIGPPIENGFYYDFAHLHISDQDLEKIEEEMEKITEENFRITFYQFCNKEEALARFQNNPYKCQIINEVPQETTLTGYGQGEFFDLCRGPHLPYLSKIKAVKLLKTSGAYWKGDSKNEMLTRIYGITFPDRKLLKEYLARIEEAKKRDHKVIGPKLGLFSLKEEAPGIPFILPKGMVIWNRLLEYWRGCHKKAGYVEIKTPSMMVKDLWERSGHWQNYRENMFLSIVEEREFAIKPMNCPGAMLFYKATKQSYRDLPWRVAEIGQVHRFEPSGALFGLFRVRCFHQDDAHIFMKPNDIESEILALLKLVDEIYTTFGLTYELALSTKPEKNTIGSDEDWDIATKGLKNALDKHGKPYDLHEGEGAFYGPKIDLKLHDALGRAWQCGTIQLDMALPDRFDLEYTDSDGQSKRPVMLHRAIYGSIERFLGSLIEFYAGKFPLWLSPTQVCIISVADRHKEYAEQLCAKLQEEHFEAVVDSSSESVSKKVRQAQLAQYNYIVVVGDQEVENRTLSLRTRDNIVHGQMQFDLFLEKILQERSTKSLHSAFEN